MRKVLIGCVLVIALALAGLAKEKVEKVTLEQRVVALELQISVLSEGVAADIGVLDDRTINLHERLMILESGPVRLKAGL